LVKGARAENLLVFRVWQMSAGTVRTALDAARDDPVEAFPDPTAASDEPRRLIAGIMVGEI
jgi:hypothetical protein